LYADVSHDVTGAGVRAYEPAFALWSDGASKRRWVSLPDAPIDTSNPDDWSFPVGTRFWKEFTRGGKRIETRLLQKVGPAPGDWAGAAYVWDADQRDAWLRPDGLKDADGDGYEVPRAADCGGCSAVQLARPDLPLRVEQLSNEGRLTRLLGPSPEVASTEVERNALGYLHANCGHCHNGQRPARRDGARCYDPQRSLDFWLTTDPHAAGGASLAQASSVPRYVTPGEPDASRLIALVSRRGMLLHMPPLASHQVDSRGVQLLRDWVAGMKGDE
jgi:hypothetical protein